MSGPNPPLIALLSDFGLQDAYVGIVKGVMLGLCPQARLVDLSHLIAPGDLRQGAYQLWSAAPYFPPGTVFLAVIDPGVGSARRALALRAGGHYYVGPDNGLLSWAAPQADEAVALPLPSGSSRTFHGRDLFAPAAARLAAGDALAQLGAPAGEYIRLPRPEPMALPEGLAGEILLWDRFGNGISNLPGTMLAALGEQLRVEIGNWSLPLSACYSDVPSGSPLALIGSTGLLEISIRDGDARASLEALSPGIRVTPAGSPP